MKDIIDCGFIYYVHFLINVLSLNTVVRSVICLSLCCNFIPDQHHERYVLCMCCDKIAKQLVKQDQKKI